MTDVYSKNNVNSHSLKKSPSLLLDFNVNASCLAVVEIISQSGATVLIVRANHKSENGSCDIAAQSRGLQKRSDSGVESNY